MVQADGQRDADLPGVLDDLIHVGEIGIVGSAQILVGEGFAEDRGGLHIAGAALSHHLGHVEAFEVAVVEDEPGLGQVVAAGEIPLGIPQPETGPALAVEEVAAIGRYCMGRGWFMIWSLRRGDGGRLRSKTRAGGPPAEVRAKKYLTRLSGIIAVSLRVSRTAATI